MSNSTRGELGLERSLAPCLFLQHPRFCGCCRDGVSSVQLSHESAVIPDIHVPTARMECEQPSKLQDSVTCPQQVLSHLRIQSVKGGEDTTCGTALSYVPVCWSWLSASHTGCTVRGCCFCHSFSIFREFFVSNFPSADKPMSSQEQSSDSPALAVSGCDKGTSSQASPLIGAGPCCAIELLDTQIFIPAQRTRTGCPGPGLCAGPFYPCVCVGLKGKWHRITAGLGWKGP